MYKNQLTNLEIVISEFSNMQFLENLSKFTSYIYNVIECYCKLPSFFIIDLAHNPLTQEKEYRFYVIFHIPSLKVLDRQGNIF